MHMSEITPEISTQQLYTNLVTEARDLHFFAMIGQHYGDLTVNEHSEYHTNMTAGDSLLTVHHFATDVLPAGLLLRQVISTRDEDQRYIQTDALLLSTFTDSKVLTTRGYSMDKRSVAAPVDIDRLVAQLRDEGQPLDEVTMRLWYSELHTLTDNKLEQAVAAERRNQAGRRIRNILSGRHKQAS